MHHDERSADDGRSFGSAVATLAAAPRNAGNRAILNVIVFHLQRLNLQGLAFQTARKIDNGAAATDQRELTAIRGDSCSGGW